MLADDPKTIKEAGSHFRQSWNLNTTVTIHNQLPVPGGDTTRFDCIYIASSMAKSYEAKFRVLVDYCRAAAKSGSFVYLEPDCSIYGLHDLIGLEQVSPVASRAAFPIFSSFPSHLRHIEFLLTHSATEARSGARTQYEKTHLPTFVDTGNVQSEWIVAQDSIASKAQTLVTDRNGQPLLTWREIGKGGVLWSADFSRRSVPFHDVETIRDFGLGFPDPSASNFHYGEAGLDFLFRDQLVDVSAKLKYGISIRRVPGPNGAPACAFQNHLDAYDNWTSEYAVRWSRLLLERGLIPSFTVRSDLTQFDRPELNGSQPNAQRFAQFCNQFGIPVNLHLTFEPTDSDLTETEKIQKDIQGLEAIGIERSRITGADHHVFFTHARPIWQSFHSLIKNNLFHDFGGSTMSCFELFSHSFCTSVAYAPYSPPFILENSDQTLLPLVIGSPLPARPLFGAFESRCVLPTGLRMPVMQYFHPEFIYHAEAFGDLDAEFRTMIAALEHLRDVQGYCPLTEPQIARSILANRTASIRARVSPDGILFETDASQAMTEAGPFRNALGVRIETAAQMTPAAGWTTNAPVRYLNPNDGSLELGLWPDKETSIRFQRPTENDFYIERINMPFTLVESQERIELTIREPGLRWIRLPVRMDSQEGWLPETFNGSVNRHLRWIDLFQTGAEPLSLSIKRFQGEAFNRVLRELIQTRSDVQPVMELDFGMPEVRPFLGDGWCIIDEISDERSVTWSSGALSSTLQIPLENSSDLKGELDVSPYTIGRTEPQRLTVIINDQPVLKSFELKPGWQMVRFDIPASLIVHGVNDVTFSYKFVGCPGLDLKDCTDFRLLGVMFDRLRLKKGKAAGESVL